MPARIRTYSVAWAAVRVKRGSMTIRFARLISLARQEVLDRDRMRFGRIAAHDDMVFELRRSLHELVCAP